jgi:hypothetical protein
MLYIPNPQSTSYELEDLPDLYVNLNPVSAAESFRPVDTAPLGFSWSMGLAVP